MIVESDSAVAINFISKGVALSHPCFNLVSHIRKVMDDEGGQFEVVHALREANQVADWLRVAMLILQMIAEELFPRAVLG